MSSVLLHEVIDSFMLLERFVNVTVKLNRAKIIRIVIQECTLEAAGYFFVLSTLDRTFTAEEILEIYGVHWQVELAFKRLKSILRVGQLHNKNPLSAKAWLHGKILVAFLVTAIIKAGRSFSPWGYLVRVTRPSHPEHLEGNFIFDPLGSAIRQRPRLAYCIENSGRIESSLRERPRKRQLKHETVLRKVDAKQES